MDFAGALMRLLEASLMLWNHHEANKYRDEFIKLKKEYYDEKSKSNPNMALLDYNEYRIFLLSGTVSSAITRQASPDTPGETGALL